LHGAWSIGHGEISIRCPPVPRLLDLKSSGGRRDPLSESLYAMRSEFCAERSKLSPDTKKGRARDGPAIKRLRLSTSGGSAFVRFFCDPYSTGIFVAQGTKPFTFMDLRNRL